MQALFRLKETVSKIGGLCYILTVAINLIKDNSLKSKNHFYISSYRVIDAVNSQGIFA